MKLLASLLLATPLAAQVGFPGPAPGYDVDLSGYQGGGMGATLANGDFVVSNPIRMRRFDAAGNLLSVLYEYSDYPNIPSSFFGPQDLRLSPDETFVLVASGASLFRFPLPTGQPQRFNMPRDLDPLTLVFEHTQSVLFSSQQELFAPMQIWRYDLTTETETLLGTLDPPAPVGTSNLAGPMALDAVGNLLFSYGWFSGPDSFLGRIDAADLTGAVPFDESAVSVLSRNPDRITEIFPLPGAEVILVVQNDPFFASFNVPGKIQRLDPTTGTAELLFETASHNYIIEDAELVAGDHPEAFAAFQPATTSSIRFHFIAPTNDPVAPPSQRMELHPARPQLSQQPAAPGMLESTIVAGPANGFGFLLAAPAALFQNPESLYFFNGRPLFWGLDLSLMQFVEGPFLLDAGGSHASTLPAPQPGLVAGQAVLFHADLTLAGSTNAIFP